MNRIYFLCNCSQFDLFNGLTVQHWKSAHVILTRVVQVNFFFQNSFKFLIILFLNRLRFFEKLDSSLKNQSNNIKNYLFLFIFKYTHQVV